MTARTRALASRSDLPFKVVPSDEGDGRRRQAVADRVSQLWWSTTLPEHVTATIDRDSIFLGVGLGFLSWERRPGEWIPKLNPLPLHGLSFHPWSNEWHYLDGAGRDHLVTPGKNGWFLHLPHGPRSWMLGLVRTLGVDFVFADLCGRAWATFCNRHGGPVLAVREPTRVLDDLEQGDAEAAAAKKKLADLYGQFRKLHSDSVIRLPQGQTKDEPGWDAEWMELTSLSYVAIRDFVKELRRNQSIAILGRASQEQAALGGDGELSSRQVKIEALATDAETLATSYREQIWKPYSEINFGDPNLAPWGRWDCRPPQDAKVRAETLKAQAEAIAAHEALGTDTAPLFEEFGLRRIKKPEPVKAPSSNEDPAASDEEAA